MADQNAAQKAFAQRGVRVGDKVVTGILGIFIPRSAAQDIGNGLADGAELGLEAAGVVPTVMPDGSIQQIPKTQPGGIPTVAPDGKVELKPKNPEKG